MPYVQGASCIFEVQCCNSDLQVGERNDHALLPPLGVDLCSKMSHLLCERLHWNWRINTSQIDLSELLDLRRISAPDSMLEFNDAYR